MLQLTLALQYRDGRKLTEMPKIRRFTHGKSNVVMSIYVHAGMPNLAGEHDNFPAKKKRTEADLPSSPTKHATFSEHNLL
jgi:hypothetical protein